MNIERKCEICGGTFHVTEYRLKHRPAKYCSKKCYGSAISTRVEIPCGICGTILTATPYHIAVGQGKYCSSRCLAEARMTKIEQFCLTCGETFMAHLSDIKIGGGRYCGSECFHRSRNFGITPLARKIRGCAEYREWREAVYARDDWTCQDCGRRGGYLHAHHIFPFAEYEEHRFAVWNGTTLCKECHMNTHFKTRSAR